MKKRFVVMTFLIVLFSCVLFRTSYATAASIPFFRLDNTSYLAGEMIEISTFNIENIEGKKYIEILWEDTGNTIFRTEIDNTRLSIRAPEVEGNYIARVVLGTETQLKKFTVTGGNVEACSLRAKTIQNEDKQVLGILMTWTQVTVDQTYFVTRIEMDGTSVSYGPINADHWIDTNIAPNTTYIYSVSDGKRTSNTVILDLSEFIPAEYSKNHNMGSIMLCIDSPYMIVNGISERIDPDDIKIVPVIMQNRTMLPIRALVEKMGGVVDWVDKTQTVMLQAWGQRVEIPIGKTDILVNEGPRVFDVPAVVRNDRTFVPIRHLEFLGCEVSWISEIQSVLILYHIEE